MNSIPTYDVIILGGGLAGLTLSLQLKNAKPDIQLLVLEKRGSAAPEATHKVGESTSELGAYYLRNVLGLSEYLSGNQLRKFGFRFFLSPENAADISSRVEIGIRIDNPFPTHQIDRGLMENALSVMVKNKNAELQTGASIKDINLSENGHSVIYEQNNNQFSANSTWIIDASGRNSLLKRKLNLNKETNHNINSSWFRVKGEIDIDDWSDNSLWRSYAEPGRRRLATNHLTGDGYWVWIIPLVSGYTSIGIVADETFHPFESFNTFSKAMQWLQKNEPLAFKMLDPYRDSVADFKVMKHFSYNTKQFYSGMRWALTGEAGAFLDPLYSPGSDIIALNNTWITDLIVRDLNKENIAMRLLTYEFTHKELFSGWLEVYQDNYRCFGKTQIMVMKIIWDWAAYWSIPCVLFMNNAYTNIDILKKYSSATNPIGKKFSLLNSRMQSLFKSWSYHESRTYETAHLNVFSLNCMSRFQTELNTKYTDEQLIQKIESNLQVLEQIAAEICRRVLHAVLGTPEDMPVNPYEMLIEDGAVLIIEKSISTSTVDISELIRNDIEKMWLVKSNSMSYV